MSWQKDDIDLAFIREYSVGGLTLSLLSWPDRVEKIRVGIWREHRKDLPFYDSGMTYQEAFTACYGKKLELRAKERGVPAQVKVEAPTQSDELDDDGDEP